LLDLQEDLANKGLLDILNGDGQFLAELSRLDGRMRNSLSTRLDLAYQGLELLRVEARVSKLEDEFGDPTGYLLIVKEAKTLQHLKRKYGITDREAEVIQHIVAGLSNLDIARQLGISERTVKAHVTSIFNKMVVDNRVQLIIQLRKYRILPDFQADVLSVSNN
jgi:DNA-binding NarL/FixJ family response regulator